MRVQSKTVSVMCVILFLLICSGFFLINRTNYTESKYTVSAPVPEEIQIVQLSDLHNAELGNENNFIIDSVGKMEPDLILMTGDMINRDDPDTSVLENLVIRLSKISPVYYGYGNHESTWDDTFGEEKGTSIRETVESCGGKVLELEYEDVVVKGETIRIGGYMGYYRFPGMLHRDPLVCEEHMSFFDDFENTEDYKILLNHIPTQWVDWGHKDDFAVDLVFCGHYHGGQWVLPFVGPLYAPYVGWNPDYVKGCFTGKTSNCILSAGLGNEYSFVPRMNNPPEIVQVTLIAE